VDAVGGIQTDALAVGSGGVIEHFVDVGGTEILAGAAELFYATGIADVGVVNKKVGGLIVFVFCAGMIEVGEFVEGELAIAFGGTD
jgi:hypothetical protein